MSKKVYLIRAAQFYKIGISGNVKKRLNCLQTGCPIKCEYIGYFPTADPEKLERQLHLKFNGFKTYGEWFDLGDHNINILIAEFSLKHVTNPFTAITQAQEVTAQAPTLKKVREASADIQEITLLYEELYPSKTLTDHGKVTIRKYLSKYGKKSVVESLYKLSERFDSKAVWDKLPHAAKTFSDYGRHVNDETWKAYYKIRECFDQSDSNKFIKCVMENGIDLDPERLILLVDYILNKWKFKSIDEALNRFIDLVREVEAIDPAENIFKPLPVS